MKVPDRISLLPADLIDRIEDAMSKTVGFTLGLAVRFVRESRREYDGEQNVRRDAVGKHLHYLRRDRGWGPLADLAWPRLRRIAETNVDIVLELENML